MKIFSSSAKDKLEIIVNGVKTNYQVFVPPGRDPAFGGREGLPAQAGKTLLILHGWGSGSDRWIKEAEIISETLRPGSGRSEGYQVIIPDLPGFGESDKLTRPWTVNDYIKWFEDFTRILEIEDFYLLGYSFGGVLALKIAVKYPQRALKLFLVAAAVIRKKTTKKNFSAKISKFVKLFYFLPYYDLLRKAIYKFIIRKSDYVYIEGIMKETYLNVISEDVSHYLSFIKVPTVIIWGDKDQSVPIDDAKVINEKIKNSKLIIIEGADHLMHKTIPEILAEKILDNLN